MAEKGRQSVDISYSSKIKQNTIEEKCPLLYCQIDFKGMSDVYELIASLRRVIPSGPEHTT